MPLFQVETDGGETVQVDTEDLPGALPDGHSLNTPAGAAEGHVTRQHHEAQVTRARNEAQESATEGMVPRDEAAQDEGVISTVLEAHGGGEEGDVDLESYRERWREDEVEPLRESLDQMRGRLLVSDLIEAGREMGVRPEYLEGGSDSYLAHRLGDRLEHDGEHGTVATDAEGNRLPGGEGRAFANASDLLGRMRESGDAQNLFADEEPQGGGGSYEGGSGAAGSGGKRTWSEEEIASMSPEEFDKHADEINQAAADGRITD
jgi:hypothetical protein